TPPTNRRQSPAGSTATHDSTCTSPRPTRPGSTKSNDGSDCSPTSGCAAALTPACRRWKKTSATGSQRGTRTQNLSPGPKPPTRYSNASPHIYSAFLAQDTSGNPPYSIPPYSAGGMD